MSMLELISRGTAHAVIVLPEHPQPAELTTATELAKHLELLAGVSVDTINVTEYVSGPMVAVGFNGRLPDSLKRERFGRLAGDEILIWSSGDVLLLAGGSPRGTLYAVYEWLHQLGVRFYSPDYTKVPHTNRISMPARYRYKPSVRGRSILVGNGGEAEWSARNRLSSIALWRHSGEAYGGGVAEGPDMHTFWRQMPVEQLQAHPEWCAEVDGNRQPPAGNTNWGLCLQPDVRAYLVQRGLEYARQHPELSTIWVGFNDGSPYCTCPKCQAFYDAHGGVPSSLVIQLANELADALAAESPNRMVKTLAYAWSIEPPKNMRARDNVVVLFCAMTNYFKPFATSTEARALCKQVEGWKRICRNVAVYLYAYPPEQYWYPTPCLYAFGRNIQWAHRLGCNDLFMQVSGFGGSFGSEAMDLRAWVYSRMMWNPSLDFHRLVEEFVRDNYGAAAAVVMKVLERDLQVASGHPYVNKAADRGLVAPEYVSPQHVREANLALEKARDAIKEPDTRSRLELFWLAYLWADVWCGFTGAGRYDAKKGTWAVPMSDGTLRNRYAKEAKRIMVEHGINGLREGVRLNPQSLAIDKMGVDWKACQLQDTATRVVVVPDVGGNLFDLRLAGSDFKPLKDVWMITIGSYPLHCAWRDIVNDDYVSGYKATQFATKQLQLEAVTPKQKVCKNVRVSDGWCVMRLDASRSDGSPASLRSSLMLDMLPAAFGDSPVVHIERRGGLWTHQTLGEGLGSFWYAYGGFDLLEATGRIIIASSTRAEGLLLEFDLAQGVSVGYDYDRYEYPHGYGHILDIAFTVPSRLATLEKPLIMELRVKLLKDAGVAAL